MNNANIFENIPAQLNEELFETLLKNSQVQIERIISKGHTSDVGIWYDQDWDEWLLLLQGSAVIEYENQPSVTLSKGDYLLIPADVKHRVSWTATDIETVWLAVHLAK